MSNLMYETLLSCRMAQDLESQKNRIYQNYIEGPPRKILHFPLTIS